MAQRIAQFALLVREYDEAIRFFVDRLNFELVEDTPLENEKRWVRVRPSGSDGPNLLLARAATDEQRAAVGRQTGGRVFIFIETDDLDRDVARLTARDVRFVRGVSIEPFGRVAVFEDLYGNKFDLIERR
ncbi:Glyoxalase/Bleomycin resistance protein/Dioxygenase superfamily protein [Phycisphaerae bacterium RAS1]|nr:Glyoxalase/Bleomycin resistance protein/Dioxygenase superfamily protein [Phycisphaerae bacterium RAS1]